MKYRIYIEVTGSKLYFSQPKGFEYIRIWQAGLEDVVLFDNKEEAILEGKYTGEKHPIHVEEVEE